MRMSLREANQQFSKAIAIGEWSWMQAPRGLIPSVAVVS